MTEPMTAEEARESADKLEGDAMLFALTEGNPNVDALQCLAATLRDYAAMKERQTVEPGPDVSGLVEALESLIVEAIGVTTSIDCWFEQTDCGGAFLEASNKEGFDDSVVALIKASGKARVTLATFKGET